MVNALSYTLVSVLIVSLLSLIGAITLFFGRQKVEKFLIYLVGFSAGALLGDAFLHLIPASVESAGGFVPAISLYILVGIFFAFVVEKILHWGHTHHFHHIRDKKEELKKKKEKAVGVRKEKSTLGYMNLFGDAMHNFVDGIVIGASYLVSIPLGFATTLAVVFHEIPQELGDFGVLLHSGFNRKKALLFNFFSAALAIAGGILAVWLSSRIDGLLFFLIPFTSRNFIYIASSNLIPELQKEPRLGRSLAQLVSMLAGIVVMIALLALG